MLGVIRGAIGEAERIEARRFGSKLEPDLRSVFKSFPVLCCVITKLEHYSRGCISACRGCRYVNLAYGIVARGEAGEHSYVISSVCGEARCELIVLEIVDIISRRLGLTLVDINGGTRVIAVESELIEAALGGSELKPGLVREQVTVVVNGGTLGVLGGEGEGVILRGTCGTFNVEKVNTGKNSTDAIEMTLDNALQAGYYSSFNSSGEVWFKFVPTVSGNYRFTVGDASRRNVYIKDSSLYSINSTSSSVSSSSNYLDADLTAGQTYYLMVDFYSSSYYDSSFYVSVGETRYGGSATDAIKLSSNSQTVGYSSSYCVGGVMWFEFTATSATNYVYLSDLNSSYYTLAELYAYSSLNSDYTLIGSYGRRTSSMSVSATADLVVGETYYVKVSFKYNSGGSSNASYADTSFTAAVYG